MEEKQQEIELIMNNDKLFVDKMRVQVEKCVQIIGRSAHNLLKLTKQILDTQEETVASKKNMSIEACLANQKKLDKWYTSFELITLRVECAFMESINELQSILKKPNKERLLTKLGRFDSEALSMKTVLDRVYPSIGDNEVVNFAFNFIKNDVGGISEIKKRPDGGIHVVSQNTSAKTVSYVMPIEAPLPMRRGLLNCVPEIIDLARCKKDPKGQAERFEGFHLTCIDAVDKNNFYLGTDTGAILKLELNELKQEETIRLTHKSSLC